MYDPNGAAWLPFIPVKNMVSLGKHAWNDYGYYTTFEVFFGNKTLGFVKLYVPELDGDTGRNGFWGGSVYNFLRASDTEENFLPWELDSDSLNKIKMSVGDIHYYKKLTRSLSMDICQEYLERIHDVTTLSGTDIDKYYNRPIVESSLRRPIESNFIINLVMLAKKYGFKADRSLKIILNDPETILDFIERLLKTKYSDVFDLYDSNYDFAKALVEGLKTKFKDNKDLDSRTTDFLNELLDRPQDRPDLNHDIANLLKFDEKARDAVKKIKQILVLSSIPEEYKLGQYTNLQTLTKLLNKSHEEDTENSGDEPILHYLRLSNSQQMNDPKEGRTLLDFLGDKGYLLSDYTTSSVYIASTTSNLDSLPMWKQYTKDASGIVMVYSNNYLNRLCKSTDYDVAKVCYLGKSENGELEVYVPSVSVDDNDIENLKKQLEILRDRVQELRKNEEDAQKLSRLYVSIREIVPFFKDVDYAYEDEYRIVSYQERFGNRNVIADGGDIYSVPRLYVYLKGSGINAEDLLLPEFDTIILGPKAPEIDFIAPYIKYQDRRIEIIRSNISYR